MLAAAKATTATFLFQKQSRTNPECHCFCVMASDREMQQRHATSYFDQSVDRQHQREHSAEAAAHEVNFGIDQLKTLRFGRACSFHSGKPRGDAAALFGRPKCRQSQLTGRPVSSSDPHKQKQKPGTQKQCSISCYSAYCLRCAMLSTDVKPDGFGSVQG